MDAAKAIRPFSDCSTKVGAVLERGGRILSVACNMQGSAKRGYYEYSRHAELRLLRNIDASGGSVYVYRAHQLSGKPLLARPCTRCRQVLLEASVRKVYFSTADGWEELKLK